MERKYRNLSSYVNRQITGSNELNHFDATPFTRLGWRHFMFVDGIIERIMTTFVFHRIAFKTINCSRIWKIENIINEIITFNYITLKVASWCSHTNMILTHTIPSSSISHVMEGCKENKNGDKDDGRKWQHT